MPGFIVEIVSPRRQVFSGEATRFRAPGIDGAFEVLHNHAPLMAAIAVGPVQLVTSSGERVVFATSGGFVQVLDNRVIMLAETVEPAYEIDVERAKKAEERARARLEGATGEERRLAEAALERARNRLRLGMGQVGSKQ